MSQSELPSGKKAEEEAEEEAGPELPQAGDLPETVHLIEAGGKRIYLLGTAHISAKSVEEAEELIRLVEPDSVCVELCEARRQSLARADSWREMDILQVIRKKQASVLLAQLILSAFQRKLGDQLGIKPGMEMIRAMETAKECGAELVMADRNIRVTLLRTWRGLGWWDKMKLLSQLIATLVVKPQLEEHEIEEMKKHDVLTQVMETFSQAFPRAKVTLIDERDIYLAEKIRTAPGKNIVAVVGAGHLRGIKERLAAGGATDLEPLMKIPKANRVLFYLQWLIPLLVVGLIGYGFTMADADVSWRMVQVWVLANGILAALGTALALAHPLTVLTAFLAAPLTSLNPMVAAGWVAGLCEAMVRKPRVRDFENLSDDITTIGGFWRNGITRILLVVVLANVGSSIGTFVGLPIMSSMLSG